MAPAQPEEQGTDCRPGWVGGPDEGQAMGPGCLVLLRAWLWLFHSKHRFLGPSCLAPTLCAEQGLWEAAEPSPACLARLSASPCPVQTCRIRLFTSSQLPVSPPTPGSPGLSPSLWDHLCLSHPWTHLYPLAPLPPKPVPQLLLSQSLNYSLPHFRSLFSCLCVCSARAVPGCPCPSSIFPVSTSLIMGASPVSSSPGNGLAFPVVRECTRLQCLWCSHGTCTEQLSRVQGVEST